MKQVYKGLVQCDNIMVILALCKALQAKCKAIDTDLYYIEINQDADIVKRQGKHGWQCQRLSLFDEFSRWLKRNPEFLQFNKESVRIKCCGLDMLRTVEQKLLPCVREDEGVWVGNLQYFATEYNCFIVSGRSINENMTVQEFKFWEELVDGIN